LGLEVRLATHAAAAIKNDATLGFKDSLLVGVKFWNPKRVIATPATGACFRRRQNPWGHASGDDPCDE
jgi:hypothetical protein